MEATFSLTNILAAATISVVVMLNAPLLVGGVTAVEVGNHRIAWTRFGWSYQYDWRHAGSYRTKILPDGTGTPEPLSMSKSGLWPWYRSSL